MRKNSWSVVGAALTPLFVACGFEDFVVGELTRGDQVELPKSAPNILEGNVEAGLEGATLAFTTGAFEPLEALAATAAGTRFEVSFPGNTAFTNLVVSARTSTRSALGFLPEIPRQVSVLDPARILPLDVVQPGQSALGVDSTLATVLLTAKAAQAGQSLQAVPPRTAQRAFVEITELATTDSRVGLVREMIERLRTAPVFVAGARPFDPAPLSGGTVDYTGDGAPDLDSGAFDAAVAEAIKAFEFNACYPDDRIRLVLLADLRPGAIDRNCSTIDPFRWAEDAPGKKVFITGALHEDTPRCGEAAPPCLEGHTIDAANSLLGNWVPNLVPMHDDGTQGDATAGDGIWTLTVDLPYFAPTGPEGVAVRIGYKYTFGEPSAGWTGTEEWPGNKRVLELRDLTGDRMIVRFDRFGDETSNKDKANLLSPAKGGCGTVIFPSEGVRPGCANDAFESQIDTDGDCVLDAWPPAGTASPLVLECPEG